jgi:hypothetical protein
MCPPDRVNLRAGLVVGRAGLVAEEREEFAGPAVVAALAIARGAERLLGAEIRRS